MTAMRKCVVAIGFCFGFALLPLTAHATVIVNITGTLAAPTFTATVDNGDVFTSYFASGTINFYAQPQSFDIVVQMNGPLGDSNPLTVRAPADGAYINVLRLSSGDFSQFTLSQSTPFTSSGAVVWGSIDQLAVLDGVTTTMHLDLGDGPATTDVRFEYNVVPEPSSLALVGLGSLGLIVAHRRSRRRFAGRHLA